MQLSSSDASWRVSSSVRVMGEHMREAADLAGGFEPHLYDVASVHHTVPNM
jgi:hypothetical protein